MKESKIGTKSVVLKTKKPYIGALICLVVVIMLTIGLKIGNNILDTKISELNTTISDSENNIEAMKQGSNLLQVSHLFNQNKSLLEKLSQRSDIVSYIEHMNFITQNYKVELSGFEYSGDQISTTVVSKSQSGQPLAYKNVVNLLQNYSNQENSLFDLGYISSISGHDSMRFAVNFFIK